MWIVLYGCEPHANYFIDVFLFTKNNNTWSATKMEGGPSGSCRKIAGRGGQDGLLCYRGDMFSRLTGTSLSFHHMTGSSNALVLTTGVIGPCYPGNNLPYLESEIKGVRIVSQADGSTSLTVRATCSSGPKVYKNQDDVAKHPVHEYLLDFSSMERRSAWLRRARPR